MDFADLRSALERRIKPQRGERLRLGLRNLYILPTRFGWLWLAGAGVLLIVAIQSQRNGPLLLTFLMLGLWLLALHLTQFNLQGLELQALPPNGGFAGEQLTYPLLCRSRCSRDGIQLGVRGGPAAAPQRLGIGESVLSVSWCPQRRGLQRPGRLRIQTTAPLGLFVCWTQWEPPIPQPVYPRRRPGPVAEVPRATRADGPQPTTSPQPQGSESWHDLRPHRPEDGLTRLAWTSLAQGRGRQTKTFADERPPAALLGPAPGLPLERALEHLSAEIWRRSQAGEAFGLELGPTRLAPATGREHRDRCLLALAEAVGGEVAAAA
jgi:uncharacterized protein (DUF58 family)